MYDGSSNDKPPPDIPALHQTIRGVSPAELIERMRERIRRRQEAGPQRPIRCGCCGQ